MLRRANEFMEMEYYLVKVGGIVFFLLTLNQKL